MQKPRTSLVSQFLRTAASQDNEIPPEPRSTRNPVALVLAVAVVTSVINLPVVIALLIFAG